MVVLWAQERISEQAFQLITRRLSDAGYEILDASVHFTGMTGAIPTKQASFTTVHVSVVWALLQKSRDLDWNDMSDLGYI